MYNDFKIGCFYLKSSTDSTIRVYENTDATGKMVLINKSDFISNAFAQMKDDSHGTIEFYLSNHSGALFGDPVIDRWKESKIMFYAEYNLDEEGKFSFYDYTSGSGVIKTIGKTSGSSPADYNFNDGLQKMIDLGYFTASVMSSGGGGGGTITATDLMDITQDSTSVTREIDNSTGKVEFTAASGGNSIPYSAQQFVDNFSGEGTSVSADIVNNKLQLHVGIDEPADVWIDMSKGISDEAIPYKLKIKLKKGNMYGYCEIVYNIDANDDRAGYWAFDINKYNALSVAHYVNDPYTFESWEIGSAQDGQEYVKADPFPSDAPDWLNNAVTNLADGGIQIDFSVDDCPITALSPSRTTYSSTNLISASTIWYMNAYENYRAFKDIIQQLDNYVDDLYETKHGVRYQEYNWKDSNGNETYGSRELTVYQDGSHTSYLIEYRLGGGETPLKMYINAYDSLIRTYPKMGIGNSWGIYDSSGSQTNFISIYNGMDTPNGVYPHLKSNANKDVPYANLTEDAVIVKKHLENFTPAASLSLSDFSTDDFMLPSDTGNTSGKVKVKNVDGFNVKNIVAGDNIDVSYDSTTGEYTIGTPLDLSGHQVKSMSAGTNIDISYDNTTGHYIIGSTANFIQFSGPVADTSLITTPEENYLYLVGSSAPYDLYAYINNSLVNVGSTDVDLSDYKTKELAQGSGISLTYDSTNKKYIIATSESFDDYKVKDLVAGNDISLSYDSIDKKYVVASTHTCAVQADDDTIYGDGTNGNKLRVANPFNPYNYYTSSQINQVVDTFHVKDLIAGDGIQVDHQGNGAWQITQIPTLGETFTLTKTVGTVAASTRPNIERSGSTSTVGIVTTSGGGIGTDGPLKVSTGGRLYANIPSYVEVQIAPDGTLRVASTDTSTGTVTFYDSEGATIGLRFVNVWPTKNGTNGDIKCYVLSGVGDDGIVTGAITVQYRNESIASAASDVKIHLTLARPVDVTPQLTTTVTKDVGVLAAYGNSGAYVEKTFYTTDIPYGSRIISVYVSKQSTGGVIVANVKSGVGIDGVTNGQVAIEFSNVWSSSASGIMAYVTFYPPIQ